VTSTDRQREFEATHLGVNGQLESVAAQPVLGEVLKRARTHLGFSLRQVEQRSGVANAHLSQIERGSIKRPDLALLLQLAELYRLDYQLVAEWAGYLGRSASGSLAGTALRLFVDLDIGQQGEVLRHIEKLRDQGQRSP
jgi:transcriptional regulator with XRE-family HTH domain